MSSISIPPLSSSRESAKQPIQLTIDNYPLSDFDLRKLKKEPPNRLTMIHSYFTEKLIETISKIKPDHLVLENCTIKDEYGDLLTSSFQQTLIIKKCFATYLVGQKKTKIQEIDDVGIWKAGEDAIFFQPSLKEFSEKATPIPKQLLPIIDAPDDRVQLEWDEVGLKKIQLKAQLNQLQCISRKLLFKAEKAILIERNDPLPFLVDLRYLSYKEHICQLRECGASLLSICQKIDASDNNIDCTLIDSITCLNETITSVITICTQLRAALLTLSHN